MRRGGGKKKARNRKDERKGSKERMAQRLGCLFAGSLLK